MTTRRTPLMDISNNDVTSTPVATASRRKSGRAVRAPDKFVPEVVSSQAEKTGAKRKRGAENGEDNASDVDEEGEEVEEEEEDSPVESAGEEEPKKSRKKAKAPRKPAAKKAKVAKVNGAETNGEARPVKLPSRPKKAGKKVALADKNAVGLYAEVYNSGDSPQDVAQTWLARYNDNSPAALTEVVNLILKSAGCDIQVTEDDINDADNIDGRIGDLQQEFQEQNITDYPLISKAKSSHAFRSSLVGFFDTLIEVLHESKLLYEDMPLLDNIHAWTSSMSSSSSRPFRHTATLVALTVISSLCKVADQHLNAAARLQRQLEAEKKKKGGNKARIADFQKKFDESEQKRDLIEKHIKEDYFTTVYVHRYRDIDPKIRTECVEALGFWIATLPSLFFEGQYLRYMGWMLSDTNGGMRHEVVKQLYKIMKNPENHANMRHFIERFRPRLVEIATRDSESGVRATAVELMDLIRQAGMLEPDDIDTIGKLIFDSEPRVRKALVPFFAENINDLYEAKVEELGGDEALEEVLVVEDEDYDTPRGGWIRLKCLAESLLSYDSQDQEEMPSQIDPSSFSNVSGLESRFTLAAQALYDKVPDLKDWEMLAGYLLFDHTARPSGTDTERALRECFKPDDKEELLLLEILNSVVKISLTKIDAEKHKDKNAKQAKADELEAKEADARKLAGIIPKLLKKYGADPRTVTVVLRLEHILNLGVFQELRQDSTVYAKLLDEISAQFNSHADKGVLSEAGAALLHARGYEELEEVTETKMQSLWEDTTNALQKINKAGELSVRGTLSNKVLTQLGNNLARLQQLASISSPVEVLEASSGNDPQLIAIVIDVIARGLYEDSNNDELDALEDNAVLSAIRSAMFYFMWKIKSLSDSIAAGEEIPDLDIDHLREFQDTFITNLIAAFSSRSTLDPVRLVGAGTVIDTHVLFSNLRPSKSKDAAGAENIYIQSLIREIAPEVQTELLSIFESLEKSFAKKSKKKLAEPLEDEAPEDTDSEPEDEEEDEDVTDSERQAEILKAEQQLCELSGKLVLGILAQVVDVARFKKRMQRNRQRLGPNFKEVIAYLDEKKEKGKKSHKSKAQQEAAAAKKKGEKEKGMRSKEVVSEDEEEDEIEEEIEDPFAEPEGEGEEEAESVIAEGEKEGNGDGEEIGEEEDEIMGD